MRDIEIAKFEGTVLAKLERIEKFIEEAENKIDGLERFQANQKAYIAAAMVIGGIVVGIVNFFMNAYSKLKQ